MNVDVHAHYLPPSVVRTVDAGGDWHGVRIQEDANGQLVSATEHLRFRLPWPNFRATLEDRLSEMDRLRVDVQLLSMTPTLWRYELGVPQAIGMAREVNDDTAP